MTTPSGKLPRFALVVVLVCLCLFFLFRYEDSAPTGIVKIDAVLAVLKEMAERFVKKPNPEPEPEIKETQPLDIESVLVNLRKELAQLDRECSETMDKVTRNGTLMKEEAQREPNYQEMMAVLFNLYERREAVAENLERMESTIALREIQIQAKKSKERTLRVIDEANLSGIIIGDEWTNTDVPERPELAVVLDEFADKMIWENTESRHAVPSVTSSPSSLPQVSLPPKPTEPIIQSSLALASAAPLQPQTALVVGNPQNERPINLARPPVPVVASAKQTATVQHQVPPSPVVPRQSTLSVRWQNTQQRTANTSPIVQPRIVQEQNVRQRITQPPQVIQPRVVSPLPAAPHRVTPPPPVAQPQFVQQQPVQYRIIQGQNVRQRIIQPPQVIRQRVIPSLPVAHYRVAPPPPVVQPRFVQRHPVQYRIVQAPPVVVVPRFVQHPGIRQVIVQPRVVYYHR